MTATQQLSDRLGTPGFSRGAPVRDLASDCQPDPDLFPLRQKAKTIVCFPCSPLVSLHLNCSWFVCVFGRRADRRGGSNRCSVPKWIWRCGGELKITMGKSNSKLKPEVVEELTRKTYCKYCQVFFCHISSLCLTCRSCSFGLCGSKTMSLPQSVEDRVFNAAIFCHTVDNKTLTLVIH